MKRVLLCLALIGWSGLCSADIYKWADAQGKIQYGDRPPDGVKAELVPSVVAPHNAGVPAAATAPAAHPAVAPVQKPATDQTKKAVQEDVEATRAAQCSEAQDRYKQSIEGRHMYKLGKDGEREYLTSEEIDAERLAAKQAVDEICTSPT
jgi:Domain of unknown function (DUF4124)